MFYNNFRQVILPTSKLNVTSVHGHKKITSTNLLYSKLSMVNDWVGCTHLFPSLSPYCCNPLISLVRYERSFGAAVYRDDRMSLGSRAQYFKLGFVYLGIIYMFNIKTRLERKIEMM